jgi:hypothetical protein
VRDLGWWLEWPRGVVRVGVVLVVAVTIAAVATKYPALLRDLGQEADGNSALSYADREVAGGNGLVADQTAVYAARGLIPTDETFNVVVDPSFEGGNDETVRYVASYYRYFLMPRRMTESARWVICYACDRAEYGDTAEVVWEGEEGISILRVER